MFEKAKWISALSIGSYEGGIVDKHSSCLFRKKIDIDGELKAAKLSVCGLGLGEYLINGQKICDEVLITPYTPYHKRVLYSVFDITSFLQKGENIFFAHVGNGFYNSAYYFQGHHLKLIFQIDVEYADGKKETLVSDKSVKTRKGPLVFNHAKSGECYDARLMKAEYKLTFFDDSSWENAFICRGPGGILEKNTRPPIKVTGIYQPKNFENGIYEAPFNTSGWVCVQVKGKPGDKIRVEYGEVIEEDGSFNNRINIFIPYDYKHVDEYLLSGNGIETFHPIFTYHGFRYFKIITDAKILDVKIHHVHSCVEKKGFFSCSDELLNKIHKMCNLTTLDNLMGIPTDCPQREQAGWTADAAIASKQASLTFEMRDLYKSWLKDVTLSQRDNGAISCIVPGNSFGWGSGTLWDSVLILLPYYIYQVYNDAECFSLYWESMEKLMDYFETMSDEGIIHYGLGDWLYPPNTKVCPAECMETAVYYLDCKIMAQMAELLGKDSRKYAEKKKVIYRNYREKYFADDSLQESQTFLATGIYCGLYTREEAENAAYNLAELIRRGDNHIYCGIWGNKFIYEALAEYGYSNLIYKAISNPDMPSYRYWIDQGMTTIPENWNFVNTDDGYMASLNHPVFSEVNNWLYTYVGGISRKEHMISIEPRLMDIVESVFVKVYGISFSYDKKQFIIETPYKQTISFMGKKIDVEGKMVISR